VVEQTLLHRSARLQPLPASAGEARRLVRQALAEVDEQAVLYAAEVAVSELVTNAILHAATPVELTVDVTTATVTVSVRDWHPRLPAQRHWGATATTGRGLSLVASLSDAYGVDPQEPVGKTVWFQLARGHGLAERVDHGGGWDVEGLLAELGGPTAQRIVLVGVPARLWSAGQQHWEAVLRELYLYAQSPTHTGEPDLRLDLTAAGRALAAISAAIDRAVAAAVTAGAPLAAQPPGHPSPLPATPESVDAELRVTTVEQAGYAALQDALDAGIELGGRSRLLIRPALPEVIALRDWACEQVLAQANDVPATPWAGTDHPRFIDPEVVKHTAPVPAWDADVVARSDRSVLAVDDNNRLVAVSGPIAAMLGWAPAELTGRRVVTIVPPRLREAHVAGFTRHLTTGETHVLGVPLVLPVLRADGTELLCHFLIERAAAEVGRTVYLAWIDRVED
jgi:PAS domain S-box-containing protein